MNIPDPLPPWLVIPGDFDAPWLQGQHPYIQTTWRPFWDAMDEQDRAAYLIRFPPTQSWQQFLLWVEVDQEVARIDAEDIASGVLQPNGSPWPKPEAVRPPWWRRLLRRRRSF